MDETRSAPVNPKPFKARYFRPRTIELTERDARHAGEGVEPGMYEMIPHGTFSRVCVYRRKLAPRARGTAQLRRVKHFATIQAVVAKAERQKHG